MAIDAHVDEVLGMRKQQTRNGEAVTRKMFELTLEDAESLRCLAESRLMTQRAVLATLIRRQVARDAKKKDSEEVM